VPSRPCVSHHHATHHAFRSLAARRGLSWSLRWKFRRNERGGLGWSVCRLRCRQLRRDVGRGGRRVSRPSLPVQERVLDRSLALQVFSVSLRISHGVDGGALREVSDGPPDPAVALQSRDSSRLAERDGLRGRCIIDPKRAVDVRLFCLVRIRRYDLQLVRTRGKEAFCEEE
jgi:hypothetical protein